MQRFIDIISGSRRAITRGQDSTLLIACKQEQNVDYAIISGTITNKAPGDVSINSYDRSFEETLAISEDGNFIETLSEDEIERLKEGDILETTFSQFAEEAKELYSPLIDERDQYIAQNILQRSKDGKVVAVVGAGHLKGIEKYLNQPDFNVWNQT